ncbi:MAG: hypothetical protein V4644_03305 [Patescibacteria group bacterium]
MNKTIGFIGQGWIGKHYADDFDARGYETVRYGLEPAYAGNRERIKDCPIVLIAVPTPTTLDGFDASALEDALSLIGPGMTAVIKSTILPGTTERLQGMFPEIIVLHSPEFLREANAAYDAAHPERNIIGIPREGERYETAAQAVLAVLPEAPFKSIVPAETAELAKYAGNVFLAIKVVYANMLSEVADAHGVEYDALRDLVAADPRIGPSHLAVMAASGHDDRPGRGAGGHCFIKDLEAFRQDYRTGVNDAEGRELLAAIVRKNNALLTGSGKDMDLLEGVYGREGKIEA